MAMVRKARCPMCGSAKATPTTSALIYCDYCGQLMDIDLEKYRSQMRPPSDDYNALEKELEPKLAAAKQRGDRAALMGHYRHLCDRYATEVEAQFTPRLKDSEFFKAYVEYRAYTRVVADLDRELAPFVERLTDANAGVKFVERDGRYLIDPATLWPIIDAQQKMSEAYRGAVTRFPDPVPDPDDTPAAVQNQIGMSLYVSGWLTMVDDATGEELLRRTGLEVGWEQVPDPLLHQVFCGHCGSKQHKPTGSRRVLCESCGKRAEVGHPTSCHSCGSPVTIGLGSKAASCEHCKAEVRLAPALS